MRISPKTIIASAVILLVVLSGCGGGGGDTKTGKGDALQAAPAEIQTLYKNQCLSCHGAELEGRMGSTTNLQQVGSRLSREQIVTTIEEGGDTMPAFADRLAREEIDGLADWLSGLN